MCLLACLKYMEHSPQHNISKASVRFLSALRLTPLKYIRKLKTPDSVEFSFRFLYNNSLLRLILFHITTTRLSFSILVSIIFCHSKFSRSPLTWLYHFTLGVLMFVKSSKIFSSFQISPVLKSFC